MVKEIDTTMYACEYCWTNYRTRNEAEKCSAHYRFLESFQQARPWRWYNVKLPEQSDDDWVFVSYIKIKNRYGGDCKDKRCLDNNVFLYMADHDYSFKYFMEEPLNSSHCHINLQSLSICDAYEMYHLIPNIKGRINTIPIKIREEINAIIQLDRHREQQKAEKLDRCVLVEKYLSMLPIYSEYTYLDLTIPDKSDKVEQDWFYESFAPSKE